MDGLLDGCKLWTVEPFNYYNAKYEMDDYPADSCAISPMAFLLLTKFNDWTFVHYVVVAKMSYILLPKKWVLDPNIPEKHKLIKFYEKFVFVLHADKM